MELHNFHWYLKSTCVKYCGIEIRTNTAYLTLFNSDIGEVGDNFVIIRGACVQCLSALIFNPNIHSPLKINTFVTSFK